MFQQGDVYQLRNGLNASSIEDCLAVCNFNWHYLTTGGMKFDDLMEVFSFH